MSKMGNRVRVIRDNYRMAKEHDPRLGWILLGILVLGIAVTAAVIAAFGNPWTWAIVGFSTTLVILSIVFSRRAMRSAYKSLEGKPGAAVAIVQNMAKQGWGITPAVAANKQQDLVHRAIGRPGIVLIGEGTSPALPALMASERKRTARFVSEAPMHEITIGPGEGQVAIGLTFADAGSFASGFGQAFTRSEAVGPPFIFVLPDTFTAPDFGRRR